ncbi:MAG TPA: mycofactocin system transcriptional regulator [Motilibacteraceae bacterium]|nr:mycofactocin system transcriptional regulator [Motilibacteraceae bacterium]
MTTTELPRQTPRPASGRPPSTTHAELERLGIALFAERGFDETSVDDIAAAAGIGRRTFFRYFASKTDLVWGDFDAGCARMAHLLAQTPADVPLLDALRRTVVDFNRLEPGQEEHHRLRMRLILDVPTLRARSTLRFEQWRRVVEEFAAARLGGAPEDLLPRTLGHCALGCALAAYEEWLRSPGADLSALLEDTFASLGAGFAPGPAPAPGSGSRRDADD